MQAFTGSASRKEEMVPRPRNVSRNALDVPAMSRNILRRAMAHRAGIA
jgi:hypothetical protein